MCLVDGLVRSDSSGKIFPAPNVLYFPLFNCTLSIFVTRLSINNLFVRWIFKIMTATKPFHHEIPNTHSTEEVLLDLQHATGAAIDVTSEIGAVEKVGSY